MKRADAATTAVLVVRPEKTGKTNSQEFSSPLRVRLLTAEGHRWVRRLFTDNTNQQRRRAIYFPAISIIRSSWANTASTIAYALAAIGLLMTSALERAFPTR